MNPPPVDDWALAASIALLERFPALDDLAVEVVQSDFLKGALLLSLLWWLWAHPGPDQERRQEIVIATLLAALAAALVSRSVAVLVPFRARPINIPDIGLPVDPRIIGWDRGHGSFPSDHAGLGFALAAGIFVASRPAGLLALVWVAIVVCLPRVYLGIHWLTDVLGGAALGGSMAFAFTRTRVRARLARPVLGFVARNPGISHAGLFLVSYGLMTRFEDLRTLAKWALYLARGGTFPRPGP